MPAFAGMTVALISLKFSFKRGGTLKLKQKEDWAQLELKFANVAIQKPTNNLGSDDLTYT